MGLDPALDGQPVDVAKDSRLETTVLWRRLDMPGHDAASLVQKAGGGAVIRGMAVFRDENDVTALQYNLHCDTAWRTIEAYVRGWRGAELVELHVRCDETGHWYLNDTLCAAVTGCQDVDLNFTPATNLLPLRRLNFTIGRMAEVRSAWLEWPGSSLQLLVQRYRRQSADTYHYEADLPNQERFIGLLQVDSMGWVVDYAGLWRAETAI